MLAGSAEDDLTDISDDESREVYLQVMQAIGQASLVAESKAVAKDPRYFLQHGARKLISSDWSNDGDDCQGRTTMPSQQAALPSAHNVLDALAELHKAGIITITGRTEPLVIDAPSAQ